MIRKIITQNDLINYVSDIVRNITLSDWKPDIIVGISRGGLIPGVMISHYFNVKFKALHVSLRDFPDTCSDLDLSEKAFNGQNILIVDDINDTGATLEWIVNDWQETYLPNDETWKNIWHNSVRFAVIADNRYSDFTVDYSSFEFDKTDDVWYEFPYENWW
jgi:hypoxanthine phosphoribosyltransferase